MSRAINKGRKKKRRPPKKIMTIPIDDSSSHRHNVNEQKMSNGGGGVEEEKKVDLRKKKKKKRSLFGRRDDEEKKEEEDGSQRRVNVTLATPIVPNETKTSSKRPSKPPVPGREGNVRDSQERELRRIPSDLPPQPLSNQLDRTSSGNPTSEGEKMKSAIVIQKVWRGLEGRRLKHEIEMKNIAAFQAHMIHGIDVILYSKRGVPRLSTLKFEHTNDNSGKRRRRKKNDLCLFY